MGAFRDGGPGFAVLVGGGLSSVPRLARELGVWVAPDEVLPVLRALLDAWKDDLRYRISRVKARLEFMVDDRGARAGVAGARRHRRRGGGRGAARAATGGGARVIGAGRDHARLDADQRSTLLSVA